MDRQQKDKCRRPAKELRQGRWSALTKIRLNLCLNRPGYSRFRGGCVARPYFDNLIIAAVADVRQNAVYNKRLHAAP